MRVVEVPGDPAEVFACATFSTLPVEPLVNDVT